MPSALRKWRWLSVPVLAALLVTAAYLGSWLSGIARAEATTAAGLEDDRVEVDGLNVRLLGIGDVAERDEAVTAVAVLDSTQSVVGVIAETDTGTAEASDSVRPADQQGEGEQTATPVIAEVAGAAMVDETKVSDVASALNSLFVLQPIQFDSRAAALTKASEATLDRAAELLADNRDGPGLRVVGHTDSDGSADGNRRLSRQRALSVIDYLVGAGVGSDRLEVEGSGEERLLVDPERTTADKQRNRRIEWEPLS